MSAATPGSPDWPTQTLGGAYNQAANAGGDDAYIMKFNSSGVRQWATYYGGSGTDIATSMTTDASGKVYVCGITCQPDLPVVNPGGGAYFQGHLHASRKMPLFSDSVLWACWSGQPIWEVPGEATRPMESRLQ